MKREGGGLGGRETRGRGTTDSYDVVQVMAHSANNSQVQIPMAACLPTHVHVHVRSFSQARVVCVASRPLIVFNCVPPTLAFCFRCFLF